jgi:hypothetical protein
MLLFLTMLVDLLGAAACLWFAFYLLGRALPSRVTLRTAAVLLALGAAFFIAYLRLNQSVPGNAAVWGALLAFALAAWYDIAYQLMPAADRRRARWLARFIYAGTLIKIVMLLATSPSLAGEIGERLWIRPVWTFANAAIVPAGADILLQVITIAAAVHHFVVAGRAGIGPHSLSTWAASALAVAAVLYGLLAIALGRPLPSLVQDLFLLGAVCLLGYAVTIHQAFVERQTTLQDFPIASLAIAALSAVYVVVARRAGASGVVVGVVTMLAVLTHSVYDIVRGFLDRLFHRRQAALRQELHAVARNIGELDTLQHSLQRGFTAFCQLVGAPGGFVAVRENGRYRVAASLRSLPMDSTLEAARLEVDEVCAPASPPAAGIAWLAPAFAGTERAGVVGLLARSHGSGYTEADLDVLAEAADWVGLTLGLANKQRELEEALGRLAQQVNSQAIQIQAAPEGLTQAAQAEPDPGFVRAIEDGLRHLSDYTTLAQSPLGEHLRLTETSGLERGRALRQRLVEAIDLLRPEGPRPHDPLPRAWHHYAVLYDAYVDDVPNREIMARLYVAETTFNRVRRKALRGVARHLLEQRELASPRL